MSEETIEGGCRCGAVRFRVEGAPLLTAACHCSGCQRMTASAFSLTAAFPEAQFELLAGEPVLGGLRAATRHYFCPSCMSWLFTRPQGLDGFVNVRSSMLDDPRLTKPFAEFWTREKLAWVTTPAAHRFETVPPMEAVGELIAGYAAARAAEA